MLISRSPNVPKHSVILLLISLIVAAFADCPHCYELAKVKLIYHEGTERVGYMPVYGAYGSVPEMEHVDLKDAIVKVKGESISFVEKYYTFEEIGPLVAEEDIEQINLDTLEHIIFLSWHKEFSGAGPLDQLPRTAIKKLEIGPILHVKIIDNGVCEERYINLNPKISEGEFSLLINYGAQEVRYNDDIHWLFGLVLYPHIYESHYNKFPSVHIVTDEFQQSLEKTELHVKALSYPTSDTSIAAYLSALRDKYQRRVTAYNAILSYLKDNNTTGLEDFIVDQLSVDTEDSLLQLVRNSKGKSKLVTMAELLPILKEPLLFGEEYDLSNQSLEAYQIILLVHCWD